MMGTLLGLIGAGGSILTVPILFYFFGQEAIFATTNSLFVVGMAALVGAVIQAQKGDTNIKVGYISQFQALQAFLLRDISFYPLFRIS
ncbi:hypothetical protein [Leptospira saintgironsiae]|uniref:hypothetical protein n=1 Tax=Leptospira saintgironsiae TaxID=2023183 RepID=UPI001FCB88F3|nr:hypothetical protein [Leptospira saintgironsiae]